MSIFPFLIGAVVGAFVINLFNKGPFFADYLFDSVVTAIVGCFIATGIWWLMNNAELNALPAEALPVAILVPEQVSVEEEPPLGEIPKPQIDFGRADFE